MATKKRKCDLIQTDNTERDTDLPPIIQTWSRFLVMAMYLPEGTSNTLSKLSPFVLHKTFQGLCGELKSLKKLTNGSILIQCMNSKQSALLRSTKTFAGIKVSITPHEKLNSSKGVIRSPDLRYVEEQEIVDSIPSVTSAKRITITKGNKKVPTNTFILDFTQPTPPSTLTFGYTKLNVDPYVPNPLRCFQCQRYGHHKSNCRGQACCSNCGKKDHERENCSNDPYCINCKGLHPATDKNCPEWILEKKVQAPQDPKEHYQHRSPKDFATTSTDVIVDSLCPHGWTEFRDKCYFFSPTYQTYYTWRGARNMCSARNSSLLVIKNMDELHWLRNQVAPSRGVQVNAFWIGLQYTHQARWQWIDGSKYNMSDPSDDYVNPSARNHSGLVCGALKRTISSQSNFIHESWCSTKYGVVCTRQNGELDVCSAEDGWHFINGQCYRLFDQKVDWYDARRTCNQNDADLAVIPDVHMNTMLSSLVPCNTADNEAWIGLSDTMSPGTIENINHTVPSYTLYRFPPSIVQRGRTCVFSSPVYGNRWDTSICSTERKFLCQKAVGECPDGWLSNGTNCYQVNVILRTWSAAKNYCHQQGSSLLTILSPGTQQFIGDTMERQHIQRAWLGLNVNINSTHWSTGQSVNILGNRLYWRPPVVNMSTVECGIITKGTQDIYWSHDDCNLTLPFVCEAKVWTFVHPKAYNTSGSNNNTDQWSAQCGLGWTLNFLDGSCYKVVGNRASWRAAETDCVRRGGNLLSIGSPREQNTVQIILSTGPYASLGANYWIGANQMNSQGGWQWTDNSAFQYLNWHQGQPQQDLDSQCAAIAPVQWRYQWGTSRCDEKQFYICEKRALPDPMAALPQPTSAPPRVCKMEPLISGTNSVQDMTAISGSPSVDDKHSVQHSRMTSGSSWTANPNNTHIGKNITVRFATVMEIKAIQTAGDVELNQGLNSFKLLYQNNFYSHWVTYEDPPQIMKPTPLNPTTYNGAVALRFDVLVCSADCGSIPLMEGPSPIGLHQLTESSSMDFVHSAQQSLLQQTTRHSSWQFAWVPLYSDHHQYIQVDLAVRVQVTGVATRGRPDAPMWVTSYKLSHSVDGTDWFPYGPFTTLPQTFEGNWDQLTTRKHLLVIPFSARYVRLWPQQWHGEIGLRWELYGCPGPHSGTKIGCYSETKGSKEFSFAPYRAPAFISLWPPMCIHHCHEHGYHYAGISNGICWCGNSYGKNGPSKDCNQPCQPPNSRFNCGGASAVVVYSTGLAPGYMVCPMGWESYGDSCYYPQMSTQVWKQAVLECRGKGADLLYIQNLSELDFVSSFLAAYSTTAWLGLSDLQQSNFFQWSSGDAVNLTRWLPNEPQPNRALGRDCVTVDFRTLRWAVSSCDDSLMYVCKTPKQPSKSPPALPVTLGCEDSNWIGHYTSCYMVLDHPRSWLDARSTCQAFRSTLVQVNDRFEQAYLSSLLATKSGRYWTDIKLDDKFSTYTFADGSGVVETTFWARGHPDNQGCVSLGTGDAAGLWYSCNCTNLYKAVCETTRVGFTTFRPAVTSHRSAPCPQGWIGLGEDCYQVNTVKPNLQLSWLEARQNCLNKNGDLASFSNISIQDSLWRHQLVGVRGSFWIGLTSTESGYVWSDGTPVLIQTWSRGQPNDLGGQQDCVSLFSSQGKWNDENCLLRKNWICKLPRGTDVPHLTTPSVPTVGPAGSCPNESNDWKFYMGYCYYVSDGSSDQTLSWRDARQWCQRHKADLASVSSHTENNFILRRLLNVSMSDLWIGLSEIGWDLGYKWSDGTVQIPINWNIQQPDNSIGAEDCVTMAVRNGKWNDEHCSNRYGFICKKNISAPSRPTLSPPISNGGFCPADFTMVGSKCYQVFETRMNWTAARDACQSLGDSMNKYDLASVTNALESEKIFSLLFRNTIFVRVGILLQHDARRHSSQRNPRTIIHLPAYLLCTCVFQARCVNVGTHYHDAGQWRLTPCSHLHGYICQTRRKLSIPTPQAIPNPCDRSLGFIPYESGCYLYSNRSYNWTAANEHCKTVGSFLTSVVDVFEQSFLQLLVNRQALVSPVWTGLSYTNSTESYTWVDGWPVLYTNWDNGEPMNINDDGCVIYNTTGRWHVTRCSRELPYICKITSKSIPLSPPPPTGLCPDNSWIHHQDKCYLLKPLETQTFMDAIYRCQAKSANLVSIHSEEINDFLYHSVKLLTRKSEDFWTGLHRSQDDRFQWMDGSVMQYNHFSYKLYGNITSLQLGHKWGVGDCMAVHSWNGAWDLQSCATARGYICERDQMVDTNPITIATLVPLTSSTEAPPTVPIIVPPTVPLATVTTSSSKTTQQTQTFLNQSTTNPSTVSPAPVAHNLTSNGQTTVTEMLVSQNTTTNGQTTLTAKQGSTVGLIDDPSLSPGAIVGIIFGVIIGLALTAFVGKVFWRKRQDKMGKENNSFENVGFTFDSKYEDIKLRDGVEVANGNVSHS
ncbi:hypothetical protein ScPMuIL_009886 [Solemya velum]